MRRLPDTRTIARSLGVLAALALLTAVAVHVEAFGAPAGPRAGGVTARFTETQDWDGGYQAEFTVRNQGPATLHGWTVAFDLPASAEVDSLWNGESTVSGGRVTVRNAAWNADVPAGGSTSFGLVVAHPEGISAQPARCLVNGAPCGGAPVPGPSATKPSPSAPGSPPASAPKPTGTPPQTSPPPAPTPNPDCTLDVPADPLSAAGLATPYQLSATDPEQGPCHESEPTQAAFVQAVILDPASGALAVYAPLVVDRGSTPAVRPTPPALPPGAVVGIWFGSNGNDLTLAGAGRVAGGCVNGLPGSVFGQYAYCHAPAFFAAANAAIAAHRLVVPPLGTGLDGRPCPTVRDFGVVDQDQSDNVTSTYLVTADGAVAQNTAANRARLGAAARPSANGSDNRLLDAFIDPALHCVPFTAPDLADPGAVTSALALNELQAAAGQPAPVALVPPSDPMTQADGKASRAKTDLYRLGVDQPPLPADADLRAISKAYCTQLSTTGRQRLKADRPYFQGAKSPDPAAGDLSAFLADRLKASFPLLGCKGGDS